MRKSHVLKALRSSHRQPFVKRTAKVKRCAPGTSERTHGASWCARFLRDLESSFRQYRFDGVRLRHKMRWFVVGGATQSPPATLSLRIVHYQHDNAK
jgi:hypothetical protein